MYHSLIFVDPTTNKTINTYDDWFLAPSERPVVAPAVLKDKYLEIPGASLSIDMTEALTGYPTYKNREGSFSFIVLNDLDDPKEPVKSWTYRLNQMTEFLHGKQLKMFLEDERDYFYFGRFQVEDWDTPASGFRSEVKIKYNLEPYKWTLQLTNEPWLWDPFNFETGCTTETGSKFNLDVNSPNSFTEYTFGDDGFETRVPTVPVFRVSDASVTMQVRFVNEHLGIDVTHTLADGENELLDCIITNNTWKLYVKGTGKIAIVYRKGRI